MSLCYPTSEIICLYVDFITDSCIDECNMQFVLLFFPKYEIEERISGSRLDIRSFCAVSAYYFWQLFFHCGRVSDRWEFLLVKVLYFEQVHDLMSKKTYLNNLTLFSWRQTGNLMAQTISKQEIFLTHYFSIYGRFLRAQKTKKLNIEELSRPKFDVSE